MTDAMKCMACGATGPFAFLGVESQCIGWWPRKGDDGENHEHDPNKKAAHYECLLCGTRSMVVGWKRCRCGWTSGRATMKDEP